MGLCEPAIAPPAPFNPAPTQGLEFRGVLPNLGCDLRDLSASPGGGTPSNRSRELEAYQRAGPFALSVLPVGSEGLKSINFSTEFFDLGEQQDGQALVLNAIRNLFGTRL